MMVSSFDISNQFEALLKSRGSNRYRIVLKNSLQFFLTSDFLAAGLSFTQVSRVLKRTKKRSGMASVGV